MSLLPHRFWTHWRRRFHMQQPLRRAPAQAPADRGTWTLLALAVLLAAGGAWVLVWHAQRLTALQSQLALDAAMPPGWLGAQAGLQAALPGLRFDVPAQSGVSWVPTNEGSVWIMAGMRAAPPLKIDLCQQQADARHLLPLHIGYRFDDVLQWVAHNRQRHLPDAFGLKNAVLSSEAGPQFDLSALMQESRVQEWRLQVQSGSAVAALLSDANPAQVLTMLPASSQAMKKEAWLQWGQGETARALHLQHRPDSICPLGYMQLQWFQAGKTDAVHTRAWVQAFTARQGVLPGMLLAPGVYQVPASAKPVLEDQQLFEAALQGGLLRLNGAGQIDLVPREAVTQNRSAAATWPDLQANSRLRQLFKRLYMAADGAYVRQQIQLFNREQLSGVRAGDQAYRHIRLQKTAAAASTQLQWQPVRLGPARSAASPGEVQIQDRDGQLLWAHGQMTAAAEQAGLATLLGVSPAIAGADARAADGKTPDVKAADAGDSGHGLPALLARASPGANLNAHLTLELGMQALAQQIVQCALSQQVHLDGNGCDSAPRTGSKRTPALSTASGTPRSSGDGSLPVAGLHQDAYPAARRAALLVLDADSGEILASAHAGPPAKPLLAWQHDGSNYASPGSTFKVISALGLEMSARDNPRLQALLAGVPLAEINRTAATQGYAFRTDGACYPLPCDGRQPHVTNYKDHILHASTQGGQFGMAQALAYSMNTWFAWSSELSDASLLGKAQGGVPDLLGLQSDTLAAQRPILAASQRLGFERTQRLDGGWLPDAFAWQAGDVLQSSAAHIEPAHSRHELRQIAIGLRMQTHVLQMAQVAAAIASGELHAPSLLRNVGCRSTGSGTPAYAANNAAIPLAAGIASAVTAAAVAPATVVPGRAAAATAVEKLGLPLDRIRAGMQGVVQYGTAAQAFSAPEFKSLRPFLYGKTGTAPVDDDNNSAWFIGYLEAGHLPGQTRRLAFAAWVSHTPLTGGAHAAPMAAALLGGLQRQPAVK